MHTVSQYARRAGDYAFAMFDWQQTTRYYQAVLAATAPGAQLPPSALAELHYRCPQTAFVLLPLPLCG